MDKRSLSGRNQGKPVAIADREENDTRNAADKAQERPAGGDHRSEEYRTTVDNIHSGPRPSGTSVEATVRRLRKDWPDLHARWLAGELSANAAAIEAGFRKKLTPFEQIERLIKRSLPLLTAAERHKLKTML